VELTATFLVGSACARIGEQCNQHRSSLINLNPIKIDQMYRHQNYLDAKKSLGKDSTKLPSYYVLPKWHVEMSPQGGKSKIVSSPEIAGKVLSRRRHSKPGTTSKNPNYGPNPYSLIKLKNSLIARFHSLLGGKKYPVRSGRELAPKPLTWLCEFTALPAPHSAAERNSLYFPADFRDEFAGDSPLQRRVRYETDVRGLDFRERAAGSRARETRKNVHFNTYCRSGPHRNAVSRPITCSGRALRASPSGSFEGVN
jgi:hypothetical protein